MVYAYIRVSTDKQTVENQRFEVQKFATEKGLVIDKWVSEKVSGTKIANDRKLGRHFRIKTTTSLTFCFYSRFVNLKSNECDGAVALPQ